MMRARVALVVFVALIAQVSLFSEIRLSGVAPEILLLVAVLAGFNAGPDRGAIIGFCAGLAYDIVLETPLGLAALSFSLVAHAVGSIEESLIRETWWFPMVAAGIASGFGLLLFAVAGEVTGQPGWVSGDLPRVALLVAFTNMILTPLVRGPVRWSVGAAAP